MKEGLRFSRRERGLAAMTLAAAAVAAAYVLIVEPLARQWQDLNRQIEVKTNKLIRDLRLLSAEKAIEEEHSRLSRHSLSSGIEEQDVARVLSELEDLARSEAVDIVDMRPHPVEEGDGYKEILVDVSLEAAMLPLMKFLHRIENAPNRLRVRRLTLAAESDKDGLLRCSVFISKRFIPLYGTIKKE